MSDLKITSLVSCILHITKVTHVQYSRLDSSGQNLESNGVWSKNETGSTVESTRVTGSLVIR